MRSHGSNKYFFLRQLRIYCVNAAMPRSEMNTVIIAIATASATSVTKPCLKKMKTQEAKSATSCKRTFNKEWLFLECWKNRVRIRIFSLQEGDNTKTQFKQQTFVLSGYIPQ
jgi:hypothetical protein